MQPTPLTTALTRSALLGCLSLALAPLAAAQGWSAESYGPPSRDGLVRPLQLELTRGESEDAALHVHGGTPGDMAGLILGLERSELVLPGGQTLLVGAGARSVLGRFDGAGVFEHALAEVPEAFLDVPLQAQAFHVLSRQPGRFALTLGLTVERVPEEPTAEELELPEPLFPPIMVDEIAGALFAQDFEGAIGTALNSKGDEITFDLSGELQVPVPNPFVPTLAVGGKVAFKAKVARGEDSVNAVVYDLSIGADVAATAGVTAGVAGAGAAAGQGGEVIWRYDSAAEVARAIKSMAILQATSQSVERACQLIDEHTAAARRALEVKRQAEDRARGWVRSRVPARNNRLVQGVRSWTDRSREARREVVDQGVELLEDLVHLIADARTFLDEHVYGFELRKDMEVSGSVGVGTIGDADKGETEWSLANFGANLSGSVGRKYSLRTELVPETGGFFVETKTAFTKKIAGGAGCVVGIEGEAQRVLELSQREQFDADGYAFDDGGTTVKLSLDGKLAGALGLVVTGKAGVGGQLSIEMSLRDLLAYSADAAAIVLGDDEGKIVRLLRSVPIKAAAQAHYEAGIAVGIGVDLGKEYFKAGVGGSAMLKDVGRPLEYSGERDGAALTWMLEHGPVRGDDQGLLSRLSDVENEVATAMAWR